MARSITDILGDLEHGEFAEQVSQEVAELIQKINEIGKKGELTLKFDFIPNGMGAVNIKGKHNINEPKKDRPVTMMFYNDQGDLTRMDPRQTEMNLKPVENNVKTFKQVD